MCVCVCVCVRARVCTTSLSIHLSSSFNFYCSLQSGFFLSLFSFGEQFSSSQFFPLAMSSLLLNVFIVFLILVIVFLVLSFLFDPFR